MEYVPVHRRVLCAHARLRLGRDREKKMTQIKDSQVADLHTRAAYAHTAAALGHSTGDHASAQELARKALGYSVEALNHTEEIAKDGPQSMQV